MKHPYMKFHVIFLTFTYLILQIALVNMVNVNTLIFINALLVAVMGNSIFNLRDKCKKKDEIILAMGNKIISLYKKVIKIKKEIKS